MQKPLSLSNLFVLDVWAHFHYIVIDQKMELFLGNKCIPIVLKWWNYENSPSVFATEKQTPTYFTALLVLCICSFIYVAIHACRCFPISAHLLPLRVSMRVGIPFYFFVCLQKKLSAFLMFDKYAACSHLRTCTVGFSLALSLHKFLPIRTIWFRYNAISVESNEKSEKRRLRFRKKARERESEREVQSGR